MTFPNHRIAGLLNYLEQQFVPIVKEAVGRVSQLDIRYSMMFVESMTQVNGVLCNMTLQFENETTCHELLDVLQALQEFTHYENGPDDAEYANYKFTLGDGDDEEAVFLRNGLICIWVRGWR